MGSRAVIPGSDAALGFRCGEDPRSGLQPEPLELAIKKPRLTRGKWRISSPGKVTGDHAPEPWPTRQATRKAWHFMISDRAQRLARTAREHGLTLDAPWPMEQGDERERKC